MSRQGKAAVLEEAAGTLWCDAGARLGDRVVELGLDPRGDLAEVGVDLREGGSTGTASWRWAIFDAASAFRARLQEEFGGSVPAEGLSASGTFQTNPEAQQFAMHAFGAQFAEVRVPRLLGVFAAGRIINPKTARSQLLGDMTWGLSMALQRKACWTRALAIT